MNANTNGGGELVALLGCIWMIAAFAGFFWLAVAGEFGFALVALIAGFVPAVLMGDQ